MENNNNIIRDFIISSERKDSFNFDDNSFNFDEIKKHFGTMNPTTFVDFYMYMNNITNANDMIKIINSILNLMEDKERNFSTSFINSSINHIIENYLKKTKEFITYQNSIGS